MKREGTWGVPAVSGGQDMEAGAARGLVMAGLALRGVCIVSGCAVLVAGGRALRSRRLYGLAVALAAADWVCLLRDVLWRPSPRGDVARWSDTTVGVGCLLLSATSITPERVTTMTNFAIPHSYLVVAANTVDMAPLPAAVATVVLASAYAGGVRLNPALRDGGTLVANLSMYPSLHLSWGLLTTLMRKLARRADAERTEIALQAEELAVARERNRLLRLVHDRALQALEHLGTHYADDPRIATRFARREARRLRRALRTGELRGSGFVDALNDLAEEFEERGLRVELVTGEVVEEPDAPGADAAVEAVREALANVVKHAGVEKAVVRAATVDGALTVSVRDHGAGFEAGEAPPGFGITESICARVTDAGGRADIWSAPGRGTRVVMYIPVGAG